MYRLDYTMQHELVMITLSNESKTLRFRIGSTNQLDKCEHCLLETEGGRAIRGAD